MDDGFVAVLPGVGSGMSVAIQDGVGDYAATIVSGANLRIDPEALGDAALWRDVRLLVLQNEVTEALNLAAAQAACSRQVPVLLNAAPARALPEDLAALVDLLVVNAVEAEMMGAGAVTDLASAAQAARVLAARFRGVIVTAGSKGLAARTPQDAFTLAAKTVEAVSSHGAGDAFVGALAAGLAQGTAFSAAVTGASEAAARHVAGGA